MGPSRECENIFRLRRSIVATHSRRAHRDNLAVLEWGRSYS